MEHGLHIVAAVYSRFKGEGVEMLNKEIPLNIKITQIETKLYDI